MAMVWIVCKHFICVFKTQLMVSLNISEPGATVERISYGERIILRPDPVPMDRGYEKGMFHLFKHFPFR